MAVRQHVRISHPRPPAAEGAYADAALAQTANGPARTPIGPPRAGAPHAALAIDRWNNEGGRIYEGGNGVADAAWATRDLLDLPAVPRR